MACFYNQDRVFYCEVRTESLNVIQVNISVLKVTIYEWAEYIYIHTGVLISP
jgi:hypothetical protein